MGYENRFARRGAEVSSLKKIQFQSGSIPSNNDFLTYDENILIFIFTLEPHIQI